MNYLERFKDIHSNEIGIICCNGPSLNDVDFSKINDKIIIALNRGYLKQDMNYSYLITADKRVEKEFAQELIKQQGIKFCHDFVPEVAGVFRYRLGSGKFSTDITKGMKLGHSVTIVALQIAFYMGLNPVYIVGMNHFVDYSKSIKHKMEFRNKDKDINHFTKDYYPPNYFFRFQNLEALENSYREAYKVYKSNQRELYNASSVTKLSEEIIPRINFNKI